LETFDELKREVEANQNVLTVKMEQLRDVYGVKRLGVHVCTEISGKLHGVGLGHSPGLEPDAWQDVRLFKFGTPVGDVMTAAAHPGPEGDQTLRALAENDAQEVLRQIQAIVCN
jgi:hypothetical protein